MTGVVLESVVTCPACGAASAETMPEDACQFFWDCPHCGAVVRPALGDCCVFCSYGTEPCPPVQAGDGCCAAPSGRGRRNRTGVWEVSEAHPPDLPCAHLLSFSPVS